MLDPLDAAIRKLKTENTTSIALREISFKSSVQFSLLLDALSKCLTLEMITIDNCKFTKHKKSKKNTGEEKDPILEALLETLAEHPTISWFFFTNNKIGDAGAKYITVKLGESGKFSSLTCLDLKDNLITETGALLLCHAIPNCPTLTKLVIDVTFIKVNKQIEENLEANIQRIEQFQINVIDTQNLNYQKVLVICPSLINARTKTGGLTILHLLVKDQKYTERLKEILIYRPCPFLVDITFSHNALYSAVDENKQILTKYMDSYQPLKNEHKICAKTSENEKGTLKKTRNRSRSFGMSFFHSSINHSEKIHEAEKDDEKENAKEQKQPTEKSHEKSDFQLFRRKSTSKLPNLIVVTHDNSNPLADNTTCMIGELTSSQPTESTTLSSPNSLSSQNSSPNSTPLNAELPIHSDEHKEDSTNNLFQCNK